MSIKSNIVCPVFAHNENFELIQCGKKGRLKSKKKIDQHNQREWEIAKRETEKSKKKNVDRLKQKLFRKWFEQSKSGKA